MAISPETLTLITDLRTSIDAAVDDETRRTVAAWVRAWDQLAGDWEAAAAQVTARADKVTAAELARLDRVTAALEHTAEQLGRLLGATQVGSTGAAAELVQLVHQLTPRLIASQFPTTAGATASLAVRFDRVDLQALQWIVHRTTQQITALSQPLTQQATDAMLRQLVSGIGLGLSPRDAAARMLRGLETEFNGGLTRALTISRTEILDAYRASSKQTMAANDDVLAGWMWTAELDDTTCEACWAMDSTIHDLDETGPDGHQNCLVAGATITGPSAQAATTRWFDGQVIEIETVDGRFLTVTPNHPVLTTDGWVPAGQLNEGSHLVCGLDAERVPVAVNPDDHQVPTLIEDLAESLRRTLPVTAVRVPSTPEDFHGDGSRGDVDVVLAHRGLGGHPGATPPSQPPHHLHLGLGHVQHQALPGLRRLGQPVGVGRPATNRGVRGADPLRLLRLAQLAHHRLVRLRPTTDGHARRFEAQPDHVAAHLVALGQVLLGFAGLVAGGDLLDRESFVRQGLAGELLGSVPVAVAAGAPHTPLDQGGLEAIGSYVVPGRDEIAAFTGDVVTDRVLKVRCRGFRGHVYNLQTSTGWFLANGIVTHNCRCTRTPVTKPWRDLGFDVDEPEDQRPNAEDVFRGLPEDQQLKIMGPTRLAGLNDGSIAWADLAQERTTTGWRRSFTPTPVRDLIPV